MLQSTSGGGKINKIIIGARGSLLSVSQAKEALVSLSREFPQYTFILKKITTSGDKIRNWQREDTGIFVREIEDALLAGRIDLAVHSMKDLPSRMPEGLRLAAVTKRQNPCDILVSNTKTTLLKLRKKAVIGTSSLRRKAQLLFARPDLEIRDLRGNLDTRIKKIKEKRFDAIVLAAAGLIRLGYRLNRQAGCFQEKNLFFQFIPARIMLPCAGQGALGIQIRNDDERLEKISEKINDPESFLCAKCERAFLRQIGGGCRFPLGALAEIKDNRIYLEAVAASWNGERIIRLKQDAPVDKAEILGRQLAKAVLKRGGREILNNVQENWQGYSGRRGSG